MTRIFKLVGIVVGALVVLIAIVLITVGMMFDPNDYRDQIAVAVDDATGRTLTLEGDLELNLFPRLAISLGAAELSNADGFGTDPFARIEGAELQIGLLPLLSQRIEVDRASLTGLRLNLARDANGTTNWDDLAQGGPRTDNGGLDRLDELEQVGGPDGAAGIETGDLAISVGAIAIVDAEVTWQDAAAGQDWRLSNFNLEASNFDPGRAFPLAIAFELAGAEVAVAVESEMRARVALAESTYELSDLSVELDGEGDGWPGGSGTASLAFERFLANLADQSLVLEGLELEMLGLNVNGNLNGENFIDDLSLVGGIEIEEFDPRDIMDIFDVSIETADSAALRSAGASAEFYFDSTAMGMRAMTLSLDDSSLQGSAGMRGERVEFDLEVDSIDIDRYLPPAAEGDADTDPDQGSIDEVDLPLERLQNFVATGNLAFRQARFLGLNFEDANFALAAGDGRMTLTPTGRLYGGTLDGEIGVAVAGDAGRLTIEAELANVDMAGVGRDYLNIDSLAGTGSVDLDLAATGTKVGEIKRGLDGTAAVAMTDGALLGIDIWQEIMELRATLTGPDAPAPAAGEPQTSFQRIAIGGNVEDAVLTTQEFVATLPFAGLNGAGTVDLLSLELDLTARAGLVDGPVLQQDPVLAEYAGFEIPLNITGTLDSPLVLPDVSAMLTQAVRSRAEEELQEELEEAEQEVEDRLRDRLRGLLD